jgi:ATP-binding cassette subfamily F protein 3
VILLRLDQVTHGFGVRVLLEDVSLRIPDDGRIGLVGRNGSGKSTLLRLLAGTAEPERGARVVAPRIRVGMLEQQVDPDGEETAFEYARGAFGELLGLMDREETLRAELVARGSAPPEDLESLARELGHLHDVFARLGGHAIESRVEETLEGLGVARPIWTQPLRTLSGGEKGRVAIARLLLASPDLLLLDEPTNHLDMAATEWLEGFLARSSEPFVLVSHDRKLLDRVCTSIVEIEHEQLVQHAGNYSEFARKKRARLAEEQRRYDLAMRERERQEEFIRRNIAGQKTKQAQSRRRRLEREPVPEKPPAPDERVASFDRIETMRSGSHVISARGLTMGFGERMLFRALSLDLMRGDRLGIVGGNGTGKTTLLRVLSGELRPLAGTVEWGTNVRLSALDQEGRDLADRARVIDVIWDLRPSVDELEVRTYLGAFLFRGEEVFRTVGTLSGGERTRLGLARLIWESPNLILLDEPTNHLDIASREALEEALRAYDGTLLVVSHDRYFLDAVVTRILWLDAGEARAYPGDYSEAREKRERELARTQEKDAGTVPATSRAAAAPASTPHGAGVTAGTPAESAAAEAKAARARERERRDQVERERRKRGRAREALEKRIAGLEARLTELTAAMEDDGARGDVEAVRRAGEEYAAARRDLDALYAEWSMLVE